jgi:hypothetical protein
MARSNAINYTASQFPKATAGTDAFHKEDLQVLAEAVDTHDHTPSKGLPIGIDALTNGILAASAAGLAKMADGFLAASAAARAKMANGYIVLAHLADGIFSADAAGRAKFAAGFVTDTLVATGISGAKISGAVAEATHAVSADSYVHVSHRRGGNAADWSVSGTNIYTPGVTRTQVGVATTATEFGIVSVTFPVAFSAKPIVYVSSLAENNMAAATNITTDGCIIQSGNPWIDSHPSVAVAWIAIGPA